MPLYQDIRSAIATSSKTRYRLSRETGISQSQLSQFLAGTKGLSVDALEKLADRLDLRIVVKPKKSTSSAHQKR